MPNLKPTPAQRQTFFFSANPVIVFAILAILVLLSISVFSLQKIHASQNSVVQTNLDTSLNAYSELISVWHRQNISAIQVLAESTQGKALLTQIMREQGEDEKTQRAMRDWLYPILLVMGFDGFSVINRDRILLAASSEQYRRKPVQLAETMEVLDKALEHHPAISRPVAAPFPIDGPRGPQAIGSIMQNMCIAFAPEGAPAGYFCLRFNSHSSFFPLFFKGRSGASGEIYAIDPAGRFITPARFPQGVQVQGRGAKSNKLLDNRFVHLPSTSGRAVLTDMAQALTQQQTAFSKIGYPDYRGVPVAGAGRWLDEMEMGIIVEQDISEAFAPYFAARKIIVGLSFSAIALIVLLAISSLINRRNLEMREGRFRSLLINLPVPVYMRGIDGTIIVVNPAFCELVLIQKEDLLGRNIASLPIPRWLNTLIFRPEPDVLDDEIIELQDPKAGAKYYRLVNFPVVYKAGQARQAFASVLVDVTERVVANQRLEDINQHLEYLVAERTSELMVAKDEALAASKAKAEFLANMSHEIRTPLNAIIGLAHVVLAGSLESKQRNYLEKMRASGEHLLNVINDILNFSRMEVGKLQLDEEEFSIEEVIDKTVDLLWDRADAKGLQLGVDIAPGLAPFLMGDPLRLGQILINFTANAVKFTTAGSITIRVEIVAEQDSSVDLRFVVEDTGIGIDAEKLKTLFQPFHQVDNSSTRRFEGTGLGLAICKNLAELMGATISVSSTPGVGSCFTLSTRFAKSCTPLAVPLPATAAFPQSLASLNASVLVVEDNALNQEIIQFMLESFGCRVTCVSSGGEALTAFTAARYGLVLMDIQLPGMDGVETTAQIRRLPRGTSTPIIALTANVLPGDKERYLASGMDAYIAKPINPDELHQVVMLWLEGSQVAVSSGSGTSYAELDAGGINTSVALHHLMQNHELYRRLLQRFATERADFPQTFSALLEAGQLNTALNQVHSLKSLAESLGMATLGQLAAQVEQQCRQQVIDPQTLEQLAMQIQRDTQLVNGWLSASLI